MKFFALFAVAAAQCVDDSECAIDEVCGTVTWTASDVDHVDYNADDDTAIQAASPLSECTLSTDCADA